MLINFTVENFRSFKQPHTLSMEATSIKELKDSVISRGKYKLLPSAVIYGANSSGKSNLLMAIAIMKGLILNSVKLNPDDKLHFDPFSLIDGKEELPTSFEVEFLIDTTKYRYGYEYVSAKIISEWLYETNEGEREYNLFLRSEDDINVSKKRFKEGVGKENSTPANRLFLSLAAQLNGAKSKQIIKWFRHCNLISGLDSDSYEGYTIKMFHEKLKGCDSALRFFHKLELGFEDITFNETDFRDDMLPSKIADDIKETLKKKLSGEKIISVKTTHKVYDENGIFVRTQSFNKDSMESEGTKKIIEMSGPIFDTLINGKVLLVDELDAKLHPILTQQIISLFSNLELNLNGAQLIFATHDTNLLNVKTFRRDQIWFTEKDKTEATDLYSLVEFKDANGTKIRNDRSLEKDYINGRYGAIPYIKS
jgi:uncharacterized protein